MKSYKGTLIKFYDNDIDRYRLLLKLSNYSVFTLGTGDILVFDKNEYPILYSEDLNMDWPFGLSISQVYDLIEDRIDVEVIR